MNNAINVIQYILNKFIGFIFNDMKLNNSGTVTFGWVMIVLIVFAILIGSLVAVPRAAQSYSSGHWERYRGLHYYHTKTKHKG